jgi:hypothetical protein
LRACHLRCNICSAPVGQNVGRVHRFFGGKAGSFFRRLIPSSLRHRTCSRISQTAFNTSAAPSAKAGHQPLRQTTSGQRVDTSNSQTSAQRGTAAKHPTDSPHSFGSNKSKSRASQRGQQVVQEPGFG